ncbi:MAG: hypothetical protein J7501_12145 [Bdellovibrio sp.]|nr:hypothetical protein [Bdellovibrio sp.]
MENTCVVCFKPKPTLSCGSCESAVCKKCAQFLEEGSFSFMSEAPALSKHTTFCGPCYDSAVAPALEDYQAAWNKARGIVMFFMEDSKQTRFFSRKEKEVKIEDCPDKDEVLLRLGFHAVEKGFNAMVDVEVNYKKIRKGGTYTTTSWSGVGIPTQVTSKRLLD